MTIVHSPVSLLLISSLTFCSWTSILLVHGQDGDTYVHFVEDRYQVPVYFDKYEALLGSVTLKKCIRREFPPEDHLSCSVTPKTCLWGMQRCGIDDAVEPTSRCHCQDDFWTCHAFHCPTMEAQCPPRPILTNNSTKDDEMDYICATDMTCGYDDVTCPGCDTEVPTIQCSCLAGQIFTCQEKDPCTMDLTCDQMTKDPSDLYPKPAVLERKVISKAPPKSMANDPICPMSEPVNGLEAMCNQETLECQFGYSCCCPDGTQCSPDVKCVCKDGMFECLEKSCDAFLCMGPPPLLISPFLSTIISAADSEDMNDSGLLLCPEVKEAVSLDTCTVEPGNRYYHCEYGYSCCCPASKSSPNAAHSGRFCSTDMQCTCNSGFFSCNAVLCPACPEDSPDLICPETIPTDRVTSCEGYTEGDTCGFGTINCCNGKVYAENYCTCQGDGLWDCFDGQTFCDLEKCDTDA